MEQGDRVTVPGGRSRRAPGSCGSTYSDDWSIFEDALEGADALIVTPARAASRRLTR